MALAVRNSRPGGIVARVQEGWYRATGRAELAEVLTAERSMRVHLEESIADLQARMLEPGWVELTAMGRQEFTRDGLKQITAVCRLMALKNPLIRRGIALRIAYVWGQGVSISARAGGNDSKAGGEQDVNAVIQSFLDDESNQRTFTSQQAREELERALGTDGNVFLALFTSPRTGRVQVRVLPWDEIGDVVTNPEDSSEPWFYRRCWLDAAGERQEVYYPALSHRPRVKTPSFAGADGVSHPVSWDAPVVHVKVGGLLGWRFGVPDAYCALDWAQAYKEFLTDWARLVKALSRIAWRLTARGSKQAAVKTKLGAGPSTSVLSGEPNSAGATAVMSPDMALEAVPKTGATIDSESGRPLANMVAAALDVPVTQLLGDPGLSGARAVAETLDNPTELAMQQRRELWASVLRTVLGYVIDAAVKAQQGKLKGTVSRDEDGREVVELANDTDRTIDITWPDLTDVPVNVIIDAIVKADQTGRMPPLVVARLLLEALGVEDVDEVLADMTDDAGNFVSPDASAGQAAVDAFRRGQDPAATLAGDQAPPQDQPPPGG